jgi:hypothetical protein
MEQEQLINLLEGLVEQIHIINNNATNRDIIPTEYSDNDLNNVMIIFAHILSNKATYKGAFNPNDLNLLAQDMINLVDKYLYNFKINSSN